MLKLNNISKCFNKEQALYPLSHEMTPGRTTVVIGPSGCGKSTLLRLITGLLEPDSGEVLFDNVAISDDTLAAARLRMGYVIQEGGLFPHLSGRANVAIMAEHLGWHKERIDARLVELCELMQLPVDLLGRYPAELSGGQRQRLGLMRALMLDPEVLLMDEPLGALDPMVRYDLQQELKAIFAKLARTVVLVTHDIGEAAFFADELILLREGRVVQKGTITDLFRRPADEFVERFIRAQRHSLADFEDTVI